jgi:hypothetical protein
MDTLGWPTLAERHLKTRLIMFYTITHCLIAILTDILVYKIFGKTMYIEIIGLQ